MIISHTWLLYCNHNSYLQKALHETCRQSCCRIFCLPKILHNVWYLLPVIQCFLSCIALASIQWTWHGGWTASQHEVCYCVLAMRYTWNSAWLWNSSMSTTGSLLTYRCLSNSCRTFVRSWDTGRLSEYICWISGAWFVVYCQPLERRAALVLLNWPISAIVGRHGIPSVAHLANSSLCVISPQPISPIVRKRIEFVHERVLWAR